MLEGYLWGIFEQGPDPCVCFRNQRGKKEALIGDLAGRCQSHMYPSEDAKRTLAHATSNNKIHIQQANPQGFEP